MKMNHEVNQEITECIYCGRHCNLSAPGCGRGEELARKIKEGTFDLEAAMKEREAHKREGGDHEKGHHHGRNGEYCGERHRGGHHHGEHRREEHHREEHRNGEEQE